MLKRVRLGPVIDKSKEHMGIPLISSAFVGAIPMISRLLKELGVPLDWIDSHDSEIIKKTVGSSPEYFSSTMPPRRRILRVERSLRHKSSSPSTKLKASLGRVKPIPAARCLPISCFAGMLYPAPWLNALSISATVSRASPPRLSNQNEFLSIDLLDVQPFGSSLIALGFLES